MPRRLAYGAGRAVGRAEAMGRVWEQDRGLALQVAVEEMRSRSRLEQLKEKLVMQQQAYTQKVEEEETREMRNRLSEELGINAAISGKTLEDLGDAAQDPHTVLGYSQASREVAKTKQLKTEKQAAQTFSSLSSEVRTELVGKGVDIRDPDAYGPAVKEIFERKRAEAGRMTDEEVLKASVSEFRWIYSQVAGGYGDAEELIGSDPDLRSAIDEEGTVDWAKLKTLLQQRWERANKGETAPAPPPDMGDADSWARDAINRLSIGGQ